MSASPRVCFSSSSSSSSSSPSPLPPPRLQPYCDPSLLNQTRSQCSFLADNMDDGDSVLLLLLLLSTILVILIVGSSSVRARVHPANSNSPASYFAFKKRKRERKRKRQIQAESQFNAAQYGNTLGKEVDHHNSPIRLQTVKNYAWHPCTLRIIYKHERRVQPGL